MIIVDVVSRVPYVNDSDHCDHVNGRGAGLCIGLHACGGLRLRGGDHDHDGVRVRVHVRAHDVRAHVRAQVQAHDVRVRLHGHRL